MSAHLGPTVKMFLAKPTNERRMVIASLYHKPESTDLKHLEVSGCVVHNVVGDVVTLECNSENLTRLAAYPEVRSIELSGPLQPES